MEYIADSFFQKPKSKSKLEWKIYNPIDYQNYYKIEYYFGDVKLEGNKEWPIQNH